MNTRFRFALASLALLLAALPSFAAEPTVAFLGNGLEVVLIENHGTPMIAATMVVGAGADWETAGSSGASHMMEHLLFNGTERRTQKELYDETDLYGIYNNATTRRFHTDYFVLVAKDRIAWGPAAALVVGQSIGGHLGSRITVVVGDAILMRIYAVLLLVFAVVLFL